MVAGSSPARGAKSAHKLLILFGYFSRTLIAYIAIGETLRDEKDLIKACRKVFEGFGSALWLIDVEHRKFRV
jgi:hypothetical protein